MRIASGRLSVASKRAGAKRVTRKFFGWLLATVLLTTGSAEAQQQGKIAKIGWLGAGSASAQGGPRDLFWREFSKLGYVEGKNIAFESRYGENNFSRLPALAVELVRLKVDVLVMNTTPAALAAKNATSTIPIVFLGV